MSWGGAQVKKKCLYVFMFVTFSITQTNSSISYENNHQQWETWEFSLMC